MSQNKVILTITGIPGATLHKNTKVKIPFSVSKRDFLYRKNNKKYKGEDGDKIVYKGIRKIWDLEAVPCSKTIKLTQEAYDYMTSKESPEWYHKKDWGRLSSIQRLEIHFQRICDANNGLNFNYSILDD